MSKQEENTRPRGSLIVGVSLGMVGLFMVVRVSGALIGPNRAPAPTRHASTPTSSPTETMRPTHTLSATPRPPTLTATPSPSPTPTPIGLAVAPDILRRYEGYFADLAQRFPGIVIVAAKDQPSAATDGPGQRAEGVIYWTRQTPERGHLLREEPYAAVVHPLLGREGFSLAQLAALASGQDSKLGFVTGDGGIAARELLGVEKLGPKAISASSWGAAKEYVATHEGTCALIPWEIVDWRASAIPVEGQRLDPRSLQGYPLLRRLWLSAGPALPKPLINDLSAALRYAPPNTVELVAVGDLMLGRHVGELIQQKGGRFPFEGQGIRSLLSGADIAFGNLECPISQRGAPYPKMYIFRAEPRVVEGLVYAGFDILSLANNHTGDYSDAALLDTLTLIQETGIRTVGAGSNITHAHEAQVFQIAGVRLAFLAYDQVAPIPFVATANSPGSAAMDRQRMIADVRKARQSADVVVVSCHWGVEYTPYATATQKQLAQALIEAGAGLVIGHHPHVVQGLRYDTRGLVAYSLGDFVFDLVYPIDPPEVHEGLVLRCLLDASGVKTAELLPVYINGYQPSLVSGEIAARTWGRMMRVTKEESGLPR